MNDEHRGRGGFGAAFVLLIVIGVIAKFIWWIAVGFGVVLAFAGAGLLLYRADERRSNRLIAEREIAQRADQQHAQILAGDDRGIYGAFPPAGAPKPAPVAERLLRPGENWAEYLAETRRTALASDTRGVHGDYPPAAP